MLYSIVDDGKVKGTLVGSPTIDSAPGPREKITSSTEQKLKATISADKPSVMTSSSDVAMETERSAEPELVGSKEMRTVFVSNLSMAITEEKLREKFAEVCYVFVFTYLPYHGFKIDQMC